MTHSERIEVIIDNLYIIMGAAAALQEKIKDPELQVAIDKILEAIDASK